MRIDHDIGALGALISDYPNSPGKAFTRRNANEHGIASKR